LKSEEEIKQMLDKLKSQYEDRAPRVLGYPCNQDFQYPELADFLNYHVNNVGSSFSAEIPYPLNSHELEQEVIEQMVKLYDAPGLDTHRGYITTGGTEGNMYGMYLGREHFDGNCTFVFSKSVHYSIFKAAKMLDVDYRLIDIDIFGEIDYNHFERVVKDINSPVVIVANIGSTMTGGIDHVDKLIKTVEKLGIDYYIHCDAALNGFMIPFIDRTSTPCLPSFSKNIYSIAMSVHKFIGSPFPCGVVLADKKCMNKVSNNIAYIHSDDYTITGSRSGLSPIILWLALNKISWEDYSKKVHDCLENSRFLCEEINKIVDGRRAFIANSYSNTVVFPEPSQQLVNKWFIATQDKWAHCVIMPSVEKESLEEFIREYKHDYQMRSVREMRSMSEGYN
jgi:histidine decarboxylase